MSKSWESQKALREVVMAVDDESQVTEPLCVPIKLARYSPAGFGRASGVSIEAHTSVKSALPRNYPGKLKNTSLCPRTRLEF